MQIETDIRTTMYGNINLKIRQKFKNLNNLKQKCQIIALARTPSKISLYFLLVSKIVLISYNHDKLVFLHIQHNIIS